MTNMNYVEIPINSLAPGERFFFLDGRDPGIVSCSGRLIYVNSCRALVEIDGGIRVCEFVDSRTGKVITFEKRDDKRVSWAPETPVVRRAA